MHILMLHGINHSLFGKRDPAQYGSDTLDQINASLSVLGTDPTCFLKQHQPPSLRPPEFLIFQD